MDRTAEVEGNAGRGLSGQDKVLLKNRMKAHCVEQAMRTPHVSYVRCTSMQSRSSRIPVYLDLFVSVSINAGNPSGILYVLASCKAPAF